MVVLFSSRLYFLPRAEGTSADFSFFIKICDSLRSAKLRNFVWLTFAVSSFFEELIPAIRYIFLSTKEDKRMCPIIRLRNFG
jgi:hypothetical protein